ncbi:hypothetical protein V6Z12_D07G051000 [Gossypium hirsutum]
MRKLGSPANKPEYGFIPLGNKSSADDAPFKYLDFINHPSANPQDARIVYSLSLAFHHTKSPHYKVVCVRDPDPWLNISDDPDSNFVSQQIEIYSSQTRSWRLSGKPFLAHVNTEFGGGVFCNGAIHWLGAWNNTSFYFNVQDEELRDLPMPPIPDDWEDLRQCRYFGESQNHLHTSNNSILCVQD